MRTIRTILVAMMLVAFGLGSVAMAAGGPAQTGQGIMVNLAAGGDFVITGSQVWKYCNGPDSCTDTYGNTIAPASSYFNNTWDGNTPTLVSCTPSAKCTTYGTPGAPGAPAADPTWVYGPGHSNSYACATNECTFWNGGTLAGLTYTKTADNSAGSGSTARTATYTYTYNVTPTQASVAARTAWYLFQDNSVGGAATISIDALIAGESVVVNNTFPCGSKVPGTPACGKFSFNLENNGVSRVQNLAVTVTDSSDNVVFTNSGIAATIMPCDDVTTICSGPLTSQGYTFPYKTNAGSNGATQYLQNGDAYTIMTTNDVPGGGFGQIDLQAAIMATQQVTLGPGSYTVTLTGTIKGNSASNNISFSVSSQIHISAGSCTQ